MPSLDPQSLFAAAKCYTCLGLSDVESIELALLSQVSLLNAGVIDWLARVSSGGGAIPTTQTQQALSAFLNSTDAAGITGMIEALLICVPDNLVAATTPLIKGTGNSPWTNHAFTASDLNVYGLKGNGTTKYLETGVTPNASSLSNTSCGLSTYSFSPSGKADTEIGCSDGLGNALQLSISNGDNALADCLNVGTQRITQSNPYWTGYTCMSRVASNDLRVYSANHFTAHAQLGSTNSTAAANVLPTLPMYAFATNGNGVLTGVSHKRLRALAIHKGFTSAQSLTFSNALIALNAALIAHTGNHAVVTSWLSRVVANGGAAPAAATISALNTFMDSLDSSGLSGLIVTMNCFVPDNLIASITPLFVTPGNSNDPWTNSNFVLADLASNGLIGNGSTKKLDIGMSPLTEFTGSSIGASIYNVTASGGGTEQDMGENNDGSNCIQLHIEVAGNAICDATNDSTNRITAANAGWKGYLNMSRTASNVFKLYKANSSTGHAQLGATNAAASAGGGGTIPVFCFARNNNAGGTSFSTKRLSFSSIHFGMTQAQSLAYFNAIQALRTSLGGGFI
jgi:hypothetical protein